MHPLQGGTTQSEIPLAQPQLSTNGTEHRAVLQPTLLPANEESPLFWSLSEQEAYPGNMAGCALWGCSPGHPNLVVQLHRMTEEAAAPALTVGSPVQEPAMQPQ